MLAVPLPLESLLDTGNSLACWSKPQFEHTAL